MRTVRIMTSKVTENKMANVQCGEYTYICVNIYAYTHIYVYISYFNKVSKYKLSVSKNKYGCVSPILERREAEKIETYLLVPAFWKK